MKKPVLLLLPILALTLTSCFFSERTAEEYSDQLEINLSKEDAPTSYSEIIQTAKITRLKITTEDAGLRTYVEGKLDPQGTTETKPLTLTEAKGLTALLLLAFAFLDSDNVTYYVGLFDDLKIEAKNVPNTEEVLIGFSCVADYTVTNNKWGLVSSLTVKNVYNYVIPGKTAKVEYNVQTNFSYKV